MIPQLQDVCGVFCMEAGVTGRSAGLATGAAFFSLCLSSIYANYIYITVLFLLESVEIGGEKNAAVITIYWQVF